MYCHFSYFLNNLEITNNVNKGKGNFNYYEGK
jgi:hypothetical protein